MDAGDKNSALVLFARLAAVGVETAQFNTAYLLMRHPDLPWLSPPSFLTSSVQNTDSKSDLSPNTAYSKDLSVWGPRELVAKSSFSSDESSDASGDGTNDVIGSVASSRVDCEVRALALYAVSASQSNAESFLRMGDCYYYGCAGLPR